MVETYRTIEELRIALADFIERYTKYWLVEKLGFKSPRQAYEEHQLKAVHEFYLVSRTPGALHT